VLAHLALEVPPVTHLFNWPTIWGSGAFAINKVVLLFVLGAIVTIGFFMLGWIIQFIGHYYEGRKPAFVDDIVGLLVGPMFVVGEWLFALGWGHDMLAEIERRVGPTHLRDLAAPAAR